MEMEKGEHKQGQKCCGCCCDMRRATIIVNIIFIVVAIIDIIAVASLAAVARDSTDANVKTAYDDIKDYIVGVIVLYVLTILFSTAALVGAIKYSIVPVIINIFYMILSWILSAVFNAKASNRQNSGYNYNPAAGIIFSLIITGLFIYPQYMFVREVRAGIMTPETYPREQYSCCCV